MYLLFPILLAVSMQGGPDDPFGETQTAPALAEPAPVEPAPDAAAGFEAEPQTPSGKFTTAAEVRPILNGTRASWVAVREYDGQDLLYVTHLWTWRCGLHQISIGLNGAAPEPWPMPPCHPDQAMPGAILEGDGDPYQVFGADEVQSITVDLLYDDLSTDTATFRRSEVLMR